MNERIKELITQAGGYWEHGDFNMPKTVYFNEFDVEKFAELIVEECAAQCWTVSELEHKGDVVYQCAKRIRKHFGVEE